MNRSSPLSLLVLSAWCGLVCGLLEVGAIVLCKHTVDVNLLYGMSRHFVWLIPLTNFILFLAVGVAMSLAGWRRRGGRWLAPRLLCGLTVLPPIWAGFRQIHWLAGLVLALGIAARLVPALERRAGGFRRLVRVSLPGAAGLVLVLAAWPWGADRIEEWRQEARPLPPEGSPNVLLIVLDTVGAGHLGLYGYGRATSPTLVELASRGIRFDRAQATASWTLPSHASMFTGRWPHELHAGWLTPLDGTHLTLAGFLGARGFATAGFVANHWYCASDSGLGRGFATYRDYSLARLTAIKMATLVRRPLEGLRAVDRALRDWMALDLLEPPVRVLSWLIEDDGKSAEEVNREFLEWLSLRRQPGRPFFAFLNFNDAHHPYALPPSRFRRFASAPGGASEKDPIEEELLRSPGGPSESQIAPARDAYDDCIADLDEQLGRLLDELGRRDILGRTWVIVTADHGESFGEHPGVFRHGMSLYRTERHVPLLIVPPSGHPSGRVVTETVSLRDLAATIVDLVDPEAGSPFPGASLARFWDRASSSSADAPGAPEPALSELVPLDPFDTSPEHVGRVPWPLAAVTEGEWTYIRHEGEAREELFRWGDSAESRNLAADPASQPVLRRLHGALNRLTDGPLTPQRFRP